MNLIGLGNSFVRRASGIHFVVRAGLIILEPSFQVGCFCKKTLFVEAILIEYRKLLAQLIGSYSDVIPIALTVKEFFFSIP